MNCEIITYHYSLHAHSIITLESLCKSLLDYHIDSSSYGCPNVATGSVLTGK